MPPHARLTWPWRRRAFSVTELLVLIAVVVILTLTLVAAVHAGRRMARDVVCRSNLTRLAIATGSYANAHEGYLFVNYPSPLRISNVIYEGSTVTGWGHLHPRYLGNYHALFCPEDPGRGPNWEYGWSNWSSGGGGGDGGDGNGRGDRGRHRGWDDPQPGHGRDEDGHRGGRDDDDDYPGRHRGWDDPQPHHGRDQGGHRGGRRRGGGGADDGGGGHGWRLVSQVQCSYGYRGRQGIVSDIHAPFTVTVTEGEPEKVLGCDYYEDFFDPPRIHHSGHINLLRFNGQVERVGTVVSFGPSADDFDAAVAALDR